MSSKDESFDAFEFFSSLPALVKNIVGTLKLPLSFVNNLNKFFVFGKTVLPRSKTPSISNIKPKSGFK